MTISSEIVTGRLQGFEQSKNIEEGHIKVYDHTNYEGKVGAVESNLKPNIRTTCHKICN